MIAWNVFYQGSHIDTVFYTEQCDAEYVKTSLINHDGYPYNILVKEAK